MVETAQTCETGRPDDPKKKGLAALHGRLSTRLFALDLLTTGVVFVCLVVGSLYGFGGKTFIEELADRFGWPFDVAAILVSCAVGACGVLVILQADLCRREWKKRRSDKEAPL